MPIMQGNWKEVLNESMYELQIQFPYKLYLKLSRSTQAIYLLKMQILENAIIKIAITKINNGTTTNDSIARKISPA